MFMSGSRLMRSIKKSRSAEFQLGMKARGTILGDVGRNSKEHWDKVWREGDVHVWLAINALNKEVLISCFDQMQALFEEIGGVILLDFQDAAAIAINGQFTRSEEH